MGNSVSSDGSLSDADESRPPAERPAIVSRTDVAQARADAAKEAESMHLETADVLRATLRGHPQYSEALEQKALAALIDRAACESRQLKYKAMGASPFERLPNESIELIVQALATDLSNTELKSYALVCTSMATEIRRYRWRMQDASHASRARLKLLVQLAPNVGHHIRQLTVTNAFPQEILRYTHNLQRLNIGIIDRHIHGNVMQTVGEALIKADLKLTHFHLFNYRLPSQGHDAESRSSMIAMKGPVLPIFKALETWRTLRVVKISLRTSRACYRSGIRALAKLPLLEQLSFTNGTAGWRRHPPAPSALYDLLQETCFPKLSLFQAADADLNEIGFLGSLQLMGPSLQRIELYQPRIKEFRLTPADIEASSSSDSDGDGSVHRRRRRDEPPRERFMHPIIPKEHRLKGLHTVRIANTREHDTLEPYLHYFADLPSIQTIEITIRAVYMSRREFREDVVPLFRRFPGLRRLRLLTSVAIPKEESGLFEIPLRGNMTQKQHKRIIKHLRAALKETRIRLEVENEDAYLPTLPLNHGPRIRRGSAALEYPLADFFDGAFFNDDGLGGFEGLIEMDAAIGEMAYDVPLDTDASAAEEGLLSDIEAFLGT